MKVLAFTGSRAEYYLQRELFLKISKTIGLGLHLIVSGSILEEVDRQTISDIYSDGINIAAEVSLPSSDYSTSHSLQIAGLLPRIDDIITQVKPDIAIAYADRYETFAFALAVFHRNIVTVHIEAGDITEGGTFDDSLRHCITKMSHIFLTSTEKAADVVVSLGEEPWRIKNIGLLSYQSLSYIPSFEAEATALSLGIPPRIPIVLATMHPIPSNLKATYDECNAFLGSLSETSIQHKFFTVLTSPNRDQGCEIIHRLIDHYQHTINNFSYVESLGGLRYQSILSLARERIVIVAGNSSSVIKEAPFFGAHGLNVGNRQNGREKAISQVDVAADKSLISDALATLLSKSCAKSFNPYYQPNPVEQSITFILDTLRAHSRNDLLLKKWHGLV